MNKKEFVASVQQKYAPSLPQIDRDRYTDIPGLEGPFMLRSGKVVYYDPKEGKYYDRDRDMYMSDDEHHAHSNPRTESISFYRFCQILEGKELKEWDPNEPDEGPSGWDDMESASGEHDMNVDLTYENGIFHDEENNKFFALNYPPLNAIIGEPGDQYELGARIIVTVQYSPGRYSGNPEDGSDPDDLGDDFMELDGASMINKRTGKEVVIPDNMLEGKVIGMHGNPTYKVSYDFYNRKVSVNVN